ncbi:2-methylcitrate dehydratase PrpD [Polychaeton citri CBS 116435]|uniref:2-methylcitrate dehydratase PrpD n=1 Tax=Polychaeton citri CBS 116435 TaxID=1314669 RepID=A0A9P4QCQ7_9PEZI|nr:2-methylcitrate dehydratase PrpD [Polychaeton citri CBS 116435]
MTVSSNTQELDDTQEAMNTSIPYTAELAALVSTLSLSVLDASSAMLAGAVQPVFRSAVEMVALTHGGAGSTPVLTAIDGTVFSLSKTMLPNSIACEDFEFEHVIEDAHPALAMVPTLLSIAANHHISGKELLTAMAVGYELATRIGFASTAEVESVRGFHNPGLNGDLATAAAVSRLLHIDP